MSVDVLARGPFVAGPVRGLSNAPRSGGGTGRDLWPGRVGGPRSPGRCGIAVGDPEGVSHTRPVWVGGASTVGPDAGPRCRAPPPAARLGRGLPPGAVCGRRG